VLQPVIATHLAPFSPAPMSSPEPSSAAPRVSADAVAGHGGRGHGIQPAHLYRAVLLLFGLALLLRFFDVVARFLLVTYASAVLAVALNAIGSRLPLQRRWLAAVVGLLGIAVVGGGLALGLPLLARELHNLVEMGPGLTREIHAWEEWIRAQTGIAVHLPSVQRPRDLLGMSQALGTPSTILENVLLGLVVFFGALFALASPNQRLLTPLLRGVRREHRPALYRILQLLSERLVGWLRGVAVAMLAVGLLNAAALYALGVPNALLLGLVNGLLEFIPLVGPWLGGGLAVMVAVLNDPAKAPWVALASLAIQQIEANLITPYVMAREAEIHPFITLFAMVFFGGLFGFLGILLALPLVLLVWTVIQVVWVEGTIDTDRDPIAPVVEE
jgi:predicted PurR-regulated permease PerM